MKYIVAIILAVSLFGWRIFSLIPGDHDPYYLKFTTGDFQALVIGSSRSAQGIIPSRMAPGVYNFSFNSIIAPYGPAYAEVILKKLSPAARGPFIIEVNPSLLSNSSVRERDDVSSYSEDRGLLAKMKFLNVKPNLEYIVRSRRGPFYANLEKGPLKLHGDGWLEITQTPMHEQMKKNRVMENSYNSLFRTHILSRKRTASLKELITKLKIRGEVFLVRLPTSPEVAAIEDKYHPKFSGFARELSLELGVSYVDLFRFPDVATKDGDHLTKASAEKVTDYLKERLDLHH